MYCTGCGQPMTAGERVCGRCGTVTAPTAPFAPAAPGGPIAGMPLVAPYAAASVAIVEGRINALAYGWIIYAALEAVFGLFGLAVLHFFMANGMHQNWGSQGWGQNGWGQNAWGLGPHLSGFFLRLAWVAISLRVALAAVTGYGLLHKTSWGRILAIVAGALSLLHPILGTGLGIWTLIVLLNRENAVGYGVMATD